MDGWYSSKKETVDVDASNATSNGANGNGVHTGGSNEIGPQAGIPPRKDEPVSENASVVKIRGLPWSARETEVINFFDNITFPRGEQQITLIKNEFGKASGDAYVELSDPSEVEKAMEKNKQYMGQRYIEVIRAKFFDLHFYKTRGPEAGTPNVVKLRGLPFSASETDIQTFLHGCNIVPGTGIHIGTEPHTGRASGVAFIEMMDSQSVELALKMHKETLGHRYIEVFRSTYREMDYELKTGQDTRGGYRMGPNPGRGASRPQYDSYGGGYGGYESGYAGGYGGGGGGRGYGGGGEYERDHYSSRPGPYDRYSGGGYGGGGYDSGYHEQHAPYTGGYDYTRSAYPPPGSGAPPPSSYYGSGGAGPPPAAAPGGGGGVTIRMRGVPFSVTEAEVTEFFAPLRLAAIRIEYNEQGRPSGECDVDFYTPEDMHEGLKRDKKYMGHRYVELFPSGPGGVGGHGGRGGGGPMRRGGGPPGRGKPWQGY